MIIRRSILSTAIAASLIFGSTAAAARPVSAREGSPTTKGDDLAGVGTLGILIGLLVVAGVIAIIASDNNKKPASP